MNIKTEITCYSKYQTEFKLAGSNIKKAGAVIKLARKEEACTLQLIYLLKPVLKNHKKS